MQGAVGVPIPAAGQTMASGLAAGCRDVRRAAQCGECGPGADPVGVLAGRDEQLGGGLVADTRLLRSNPGVPAGDVSIMKSPATRWARATSRVQIAEPRPKLESLAIAMGSASSSNGMATSTGRKFSCRAMIMSLVTSANTYRGLFRGLVGGDFSQRLAVYRPLDDLAGRALRQLVDELHDSWNLVGRQPLSRPRGDRGSVLR
jgi:hypothetical protein